MTKIIWENGDLFKVTNTESETIIVTRNGFRSTKSVEQIIKEEREELNKGSTIMDNVRDEK